MRALWILLMIGGVIVFGGFAVVAVLGIPIGNGMVVRSWSIWPFLSLLAAGACAAGIFMKPREFAETMKPDEPKVADWVKEMRSGQDTTNQS
jgi:hypothetical protein